ncbi:MAG: SagB/ThcOx family dehydrogenase [Dehalococcoidia bacterium]
MKRKLFILLALLILTGCAGPTATPTPGPLDYEPVSLPEVRLTSDVSLEETLLYRRSIRDYTDEALSLAEVSQLLWAAQGITEAWGGRTAPSAGALYPLEVYLVVGDVEGLTPGVYQYRPDGHELVKVKDGDVRGELAEAALGQDSVRNGAIDIVIAAVYERTTVKYGERGIRYVHMEAGHAAQNVYLQANALDLGTVTIGAFYDDSVRDIVGMPGDVAPLYVIPVGKKG